MKPGRTLDIAIVGLACRFPGARDVAAFWENLLAGRDCISDVPPDRWDPSTFVDPQSKASDRVTTQRGGYLDAPIEFDPVAHGIMPLAVAGGEPEQFLILDVARAALADAGLEAGVPDGHRVEVVIGRGNYFNRGNLTRLQHGRVLAQTLAILRDLHPDWTDEQFEAVRADLKRGLPPFEAGTIAGQITNATAGRVADRLDLSGASFVVDAASASSLVALDLGARALVERRADLTLVGGVYIGCDVDFPMVFSQLGALSRSGEARPFARDADGTLPGEGVGVVVLKRLRDAERDGDRVYAVVKGVGLASDGRGRSLAAPSARGHARAIRRAYKRAGIDPATVSFVEGHGLGVPASDQAELLALRAVFPPSPQGRRSLGAVSARIGHAMPAAGMAGLIKTALVLHNRVVPPAAPAEEPHPLLADPQSPFRMNRAARPWIHGDRTHPRRAGVNAFGFAGISAHAVLEEHSPTADGPHPGPQPRWESEAILLDAADRAGWIARATRLLEWLGRDVNLQVALKDLAFTLNTDPDGGPFRVGIVAQSPADLRDRLQTLLARLADPECRSIRDARGTYFWEKPLAKEGTLAFLFPGEGSQYPGMLADLCPHFPEVRTRFDIADRIAIEQGRDRLPSDILYGDSSGDDADLWEIGTAVNVVLTSQWALHQLLVALGLRPDAVVGHSSGEFLALASAGALSVDADLEARLGALGVVFERLEASGRLPDARLVAVAADRVRVERVCREVGFGLTIAIDNCPHQVILAATPSAVEAVIAKLRAQGIVCEPLPFARAYHTPRFAEALGPIRSFFKDLPLRTPRARIYSCAVACAVSGGVEQVRRVAVEQWALPVAFRSTVEAMHADGVRIFVEVGARGNLTGFVEDTLRDRPHFAVAANLPRRSGMTQLNHLVASLYAQGVPVRPDHLYLRRSPVRVALDRDLPIPRELPALAVGFPEMRLSPEMAASLRSATPLPRPAAVDPPAPSMEPVTKAAPHANGHAKPRPAVERKDEPTPAPVAKKADPDRRAEPPDRPAPKSPRPTYREEAVNAHLRTMDSFLETQRQVMGAFRASRHRSVEPGPARPSPSSTPKVQPAAPEVGPWVGTIRSLQAGRRLVAVRTLDANGDPVAENHTLGGRRVSAIDPSRKGLPVVPFTVMAEMLAQAAAVLMPGRAVVALRDVQAHRWIRYEEQPFSLEIRAERDPARPQEVQVQIFNRGIPAAPPRAGGDGPVVEGRIVFDAARPPSPKATPFTLDAPRTCRFTAESLYGEQWLFHGPALQAVVRVGQTSSSGIEGTLRILPRRGLLRASEPSGLRTDPIVLDAFTHLLGCWGLDEYETEGGDLIFPLRVSEMALFGADPPEGAEVDCRIAIREVSRHRVRVDAELVGQDGRVWVRISGWEDWRFYWPNRYRDVFRHPDRVFVGERIEVPGARDETMCAVWVEPPADMGRPVWRDVLEWVQLGPEERTALRSQPGPDSELGPRIWEQLAAKEAVRRLWCEGGEAPLYPADLAIDAASGGRPRLRSLLDPSRDEIPSIATARSEGASAALACLDPEARLGIAIEAVPGPDGAAVREDERTLLRDVAGEDALVAEWAARLSCAKTAVARAAGLATRVDPDATRVVGADRATGEVLVEPGPALRAACPDLPPGPARSYTARRGEYAWAWARADA